MSKKWKRKNDKYRYSTFDNLGYLYAGAAKWQPFILWCTFFFALTTGLKNFVWIYGGKRIIDVLEKTDLSSRDFSAVFWIVVAAALTEGVLLLVMNISKTTASSRITDVRCKFVLMANRKMMTMPYIMFDRPEVGEAKRKCINATVDMVNGIEGLFRKSAHFFAQLVMLLAAAGILLLLNPLLVVMLGLLAMVNGWIINGMNRYEKEVFYDRMMPRWREKFYYYRTSSNFEFAKDVRIFDMKDAIEEKQKKVQGKIIQAAGTLYRKWSFAHVFCGLIGLLQEALMYVWLIYAVLKKGMSVADFTLYVGSIRSLNSAMTGLMELWTGMVRDSRMICDYRDFVEFPETKGQSLEKSSFYGDYKRYIEGEDKACKKIPEAKDKKYEIRFENVSFAYPGSEQYALKNLNLTLHPGQRLAVVGLNGAGKTTFIKLLCRLYEPTEGKIYLNGQDISEFCLEEYYQMIAPVFQNVECFAFPLAENISMELPENTDRDRVFSCLEKAGLKEKVEDLEWGMDTELLRFLKEDGIELSGGEKQKMALARALYKDAPVIVLDEPTAALDALAEYRTYRDFDKLIGGKTAVYISHRLSSTRFCHRVAMFEQGELVEYGTHEQLLEKGGAYARMFEVQAQYYQEKEGMADA